VKLKETLKLYLWCSLKAVELTERCQIHMKSSDAKASKCHLKFSSLMMIFIKLVYLRSVISLKWQ